MLRAVQIGMNTSDLASSLRLYSEAFGFRNAGSQVLWGDAIRVQGLDPRSLAMIWWLIGRQKFFQLELFHHSEPAQRPLRADWRPCDHGWVRIGVTVGDFDGCMATLERYGMEFLGVPVCTDGARRRAFRDPYVGVVIEVMENCAELASADAGSAGDGPAVAYIASSVSNLGSARHFYEYVLELQIEPIEILHDSSHEALWGLAGAERDGFLVKSGDVRLEIVQYCNPIGRPRPTDYRASDQGIVNVALGSRQTAVVAGALERLQVAGYAPPHLVKVLGTLCGYIMDPERELELAALPEDLDPRTGFVATWPFVSAAR